MFASVTQERCDGELVPTVTGRASGMAIHDNVGVRMREISVAPSLLADMTGYLRARGLDADAVCRTAGIDLASQATSRSRIPGPAMAAFWRAAIAATGDADFGLHCTAAANPGALDIVGYVMLSSRTAEEALRRGARLMRLLNDGLALSVAREPLRTRIRVTILPSGDAFLREEPRQIIETVLFGVVHQLRLLTGRAVVPLSVSMRHPCPATGSTEHARLFKMQPAFGAGWDEVGLSNADLDVALRSANSDLLAAFEAHAESTLMALATAATVSGRVAAEIVAGLKGEAPTIGAVARAMAMSPRSLQRKLAAEDTTFQSVLDDARRELAVRHLADPTATVAKVAWLVGFSEPSAFHRAFRRWTGQSPRAAA